MKQVYLPCPCCCDNIYMTREEWVAGGIFTCKKCGWKIRVPKHNAIPQKPKANPLTVVKVWGTRKKSVKPPK